MTRRTFTPTLRRVGVLLTATILLVAGCSGTTDDPTDRPALAPTTTDPSAPTTTADPGALTTTLRAGTGVTIDTNFGEGADQAFCQLAGRYVDAFTASAPPGDFEGFGQSLVEARSLIAQMQQDAPEELVDDVIILAQGLGTVVDALEAVDFDITRVEPDALLPLQDPDFQASAVRLQAYAETACAPQG